MCAVLWSYLTHVRWHLPLRSPNWHLLLVFRDSIYHITILHGMGATRLAVGRYKHLSLHHHHTSFPRVARVLPETLLVVQQLVDHAIHYCPSRSDSAICMQAVLSAAHAWQRPNFAEHYEITLDTARLLSWSQSWKGAVAQMYHPCHLRTVPHLLFSFVMVTTWPPRAA